MADSRTKGRVRGLLGGSSPDDALPDQPQDRPDPDAQRALQVLTLAQRTADEHLASAQHQADSIRAEARATAEQVARDAQAHFEGARREAGKSVSDARAMADQIVREAQANAAGLERQAQQRYDDVVGSLAAKRDALEQQIESMQLFDRDFRSRLRTFMQNQLRALDTDESPSNANVPQPEVVAATMDLPAQRH